MTNFNSEKGVSILLSVMILSVVLSIALGSSNVAIRQTQSMQGIGDSIIAFYAADHGVEVVMLMENPTSTETIILPNNATYIVTVTDSNDPDCNAESYCIKSIGAYKDAKRAISTVY